MSAALYQQAAPGVGGPFPGGYDCNTGGPRSRSRSEPLRTTVLGDRGGPIWCPRVVRVSIAYGRRSPLTWVNQWMVTCGYAEERDARAQIPLPIRPCICQPDPAPRPAEAATLTAAEGLYLALILGLCTSTYYDPSRPLLWTRTSLTRSLVLYDGEGFYA